MLIAKAVIKPDISDPSQTRVGWYAGGSSFLVMLLILFKMASFEVLAAENK